MAPRLLPFPPVPDVVRRQLDLIQAEEEDDDEEAGAVQPDPDVNPETGEVLDVRVRPWDLTMLSGELEAAVWSWLDDVVMWLNDAYGWQEDQVIPSCWQLHPGLAHDLAQVVFDRLDAYATATAAYVGRWHSDLEDFQRRMNASLGEGGRDCRKGEDNHKRPGQYAVNLVRREIDRGRRRAEK